MGSSLNGIGVTFSNGSTQSTAWGGQSGTVTSVATGNGLSGGTITSSGTLIVACPTQLSVGSYAIGVNQGTAGTNYSAATAGITGASGTWKNMGNMDKSVTAYSGCVGYTGTCSVAQYCRVS